MNAADASCGAPGRARIFDLAAVCISLAAIGMRLIPFRQIFTANGLLLPLPDPYYHVWRAEMLVRYFPTMPTFDPFISFPAGAHIPWPPGFDLLVALPGLLTGNPALVAPWGAVLMPLLGGLATYLTYRLGRRVLGPVAGLVAAGLLALMGGSVGFTFVGRIDHHALVAPVTLGMYLAMLAAIAADSRGRAIAWSVVCGILSAVSVACWIVTPALYFLLVPVTLVLLRAGPDKAGARRVAWYSLTAALGLVTIVVLLVADLRALPFALYQPSWFTVMLFGLAAVVGISLMYGRRVIITVLALMTACAVALALFMPGVFEPITRAVKIATGSDSAYLFASESGKIFMSGNLLDLDRVANAYTNLILIAPLILGVYLWKVRHTNGPRAGRIFLAVFFSFALLLLAAQMRFGEFAAPGVALLYGYFLVAGTGKFIAFYRGSSSPFRARLWAVLGVLGLAAALSPLISVLSNMASPSWTKSYRWMALYGRALAKHIAPPEQEAGLPAYGLLTSWEMSHLLLYTTRIPVMVSSFGTQEATLQNAKAFRMLLSDDEQKTYRELKANRIRYIVTVPLVDEANTMAAMAGLDQTFVATELKAGRDGFIHYYAPRKPYADSLQTRLLLSDGSEREVAGYRQKPLAHFRLIHEAQDAIELFGETLPPAKTFEVVAGARLDGMAEPGQTVRLRLTVESNVGRQFVYSRETQAGSDGGYGFIVPYPTEDWGAPTRILSPYRLKAGDVVIRVLVGERDVRLGRTVVVPRFAADQPTPGGKESPPVSEQR